MSSCRRLESDVVVEAACLFRDSFDSERAIAVSADVLCGGLDDGAIADVAAASVGNSEIGTEAAPRRRRFNGTLRAVAALPLPRVRLVLGDGPTVAEVVSTEFVTLLALLNTLRFPRKIKSLTLMLPVAWS